MQAADAAPGAAEMVVGVKVPPGRAAEEGGGHMSLCSQELLDAFLLQCATLISNPEYFMGKMEMELPVGKSRDEAGRCSAAISIRVEAVLHDTDIMYFISALCCY